MHAECAAVLSRPPQAGGVARGEDLWAALGAVYLDGSVLTPDQGGSASTEAFCEAVARRLGT